MGTLETFALEALKMIIPVALAYIGVLKTRTELDILYAKQRGGPAKMRRRWYTPIFYKQKEIANAAKLDSAVAVEGHREGVSGEVPVGPGGEVPGNGGPQGGGGKD